jgi:hypothetical protein
VLFATGYARDAFAANTPQAVGGEVLRKPFNAPDLAHKLRHALDGARRSAMSRG